MTALRTVSPFQAAFWLLAMATMVFLQAPIAIVVLASFNDNQVLSFPVDRFSLRWYRAVWEDFELIDSVKVSLIVAAIATVLRGGERTAPFTLRTRPAPLPPTGALSAAETIARSRRTYGRPAAGIDALIEARSKLDGDSE